MDSLKWLAMSVNQNNYQDMDRELQVKYLLHDALQHINMINLGLNPCTMLISHLLLIN